MADTSDQPDKPGKEEGSIDLSELSSISLGPDWVSGKPAPKRPHKDYDDTSERGPRGPRRDRRGALPRKRAHGDRDRGPHRDRGPRGERPERGPRHRPEIFEPVVKVDFYPEEEPFKVMTQAIRTTCRTFELFEIARLILEKQDRFVCVVRDPEQKEGDPARLHASVPDGLPFRTEEEALGHAIRHYMGEFFNTETVEVDPPSGTFQMVHKCGMTGDILGPPNYHRYQALCREHHAAKLAHVPYSKFEQRIESSREEEDINAWLESMKAQTRYIVKEDPEQVFSNLEDARLYIITQAKEKLVRPAYSARFSGKALALLNPGDPIRRSVEYLMEGQKRFPLDTANHLRGRLRRMNFAVYKRGSKGVSFVCAVKRRFRKPGEVLADNLQELVDFLEAHPNFPARDLPKAFLGIDLSKRAAPSPESVEAARDVAEEIGKVEAETAPDAPAEEAVVEATEAAPADTSPAPEAPAEPEAVAAPEPAPEPAPAPVPEPAAEPQYTPEEQGSLRQLKNDLHYLVSEGYVTEYSDGRLFVPPVREEEIRHAEKQKEAESSKEAEPAKPAEPVVPTDAPAPEPEAATQAEPVAEPEPVVESPAVPEPEASAEPAMPAEVEAEPEAPVAEPAPEPEAPVAEPAPEPEKPVAEEPPPAVEPAEPEPKAPSEDIPEPPKS